MMNQPDTRSKHTTEWRTVLVAFGVYGLLVIAIVLRPYVGPSGTFVLLAVFGGWFMSLQHECIHGHPFASTRANTALGWLPVNPFVSYLAYRSSHREHHQTDLTFPAVDPEAKYIDPQLWNQCPLILRWVFQFNMTLAGRLLIGPLSWAWLTMRAIPQLIRNRATRLVWLAQIVGAVGVIVVMNLLGVHPLLWLLGVSFGGGALTHIRAFSEHRWPANEHSRSGTVNASWFWRLLFLNNNFHHAHHEVPGLPWYELREYSQRSGAADASALGSGSYGGYGEVFRRYFFRPIGPAVHPALNLIQ